jgi:hypothetical protein
MKYPVTRFKSMDVALKEIEPFVKDAAHLQSGKPFAKFGGMRSREIVANWLLCATIQAVDKRELLFYSDPIGGDGILQDAATGQTWQTEHVFVPRQRANPGVDAKALILVAINHKCIRGGAAYASGKTLTRSHAPCRSRSTSTLFGLSISNRCTMAPTPTASLSLT